MGIKGLRFRLAARRVQQKTHKQGSAFLPKGDCRGHGGIGIGGTYRFLTRKRGREFYGSKVQAAQQQVLYLSGGGLLNRKEGTEGQKGVRKTNRAANSGPCPKGRDGKCTPRSPQTFNVAPNIVSRDFTSRGIRKVLLTDITYLFYVNGRCYNALPP